MVGLFIIMLSNGGYSGSSYGEDVGGLRRKKSEERIETENKNLSCYGLPFTR